MPIDLTVLEPAFRATIRTLLGMPANSVKRANQFNPPPAGDQATPFATVLVSEVGGEGWDDVTYANAGFGQDGFGEGNEDDNVIETITGIRHFTASIQFFRGNAKSQAMRLKTLLQSTAAIQQLQAAGIGLGKLGDVRDLSQVVDTYYESRAQLIVEFCAINQETATVATFGSFPLSITTDSTD
jgi:hypothetical protein